MKRLVAAAMLVTAMMFSAAFANALVLIDDSGIDYTNTSLSQAYIGFHMQDGNIVVTIDDDRFDGAISAIDFDVPDVDREDFFGNAIKADMSNIPDMVWLGVNDDTPNAAYLVGFEATHLDISLDATVEAYEGAFRSMGFDAEVFTSAAQSVKLATFSDGDSTWQARFNASGEGVDVILHATN